MTHSLHRAGTIDSLLNDFVIVGKAANGINSEGAKKKLSNFLITALKYGAINGGHGRGGCIYSNTIEQVLDKLTDHATVTVVFDDQSKMFSFIDYLIEEDMGLSITISGLVDIVNDYCARKEIVPDSIKHSLGVFGNKISFVNDDVLYITTMCGHSLIGFPLVQTLVENVRNGKTSAKNASLDMAKICKCGVFNPNRAEKIILTLIEKQK